MDELCKINLEKEEILKKNISKFEQKINILKKNIINCKEQIDILKSINREFNEIADLEFTNREKNKKLKNVSKNRHFNYTDPEKAKTNIFCLNSNGINGKPLNKETHKGCRLIYKKQHTMETHANSWCKHLGKYKR